MALSKFPAQRRHHLRRAAQQDHHARREERRFLQGARARDVACLSERSFLRYGPNEAKIPQKAFKRWLPRLRISGEDQVPIVAISRQLDKTCFAARSDEAPKPLSRQSRSPVKIVWSIEPEAIRRPTVQYPERRRALPLLRNMHDGREAAFWRSVSGKSISAGIKAASDSSRRVRRPQAPPDPVAMPGTTSISGRNPRMRSGALMIFAPRPSGLPAGPPWRRPRADSRSRRGRR